MKNLFPKLGLCLFLVVSSLANAGVPSMNVTVSDSTGKAAFKGSTKDDGVFTTAKLQPGKYVVQFAAKNSSVKAVNTPLSSVPTERSGKCGCRRKFLGVGVAMKVDVGAD
jgi:hypothetical protein